MTRAPERNAPAGTQEPTQESMHEPTQDPMQRQTQHGAAAVRVVPGNLAGMRVDRALAVLLDVPVNVARRLCDAGRVRLDGRRVRKGDVAHAGGRFEVDGAVTRWLDPQASPNGLTVLFEDHNVIIADKPAGIPSHPLVPGEGGTLVDLLAATYPEIAVASDDPRDGGLVHRLDTGTSGCIAVARHRDAWRELRAAFTSGTVTKRYLALVEGAWHGPAEVEIHVALVHDAQDQRRMTVATPESIHAQKASSRIRALASGAMHSLVEVEADGGRRHQVRVHLAHLGHPLVGDGLYGAPPSSDTRWHLLHAHLLGLPGRAPVTAAIPKAMRDAARIRGVLWPTALGSVGT